MYVEWGFSLNILAWLFLKHMVSFDTRLISFFFKVYWNLTEFYHTMLMCNLISMVIKCVTQFYSISIHCAILFRLYQRSFKRAIKTQFIEHDYYSFTYQNNVIVHKKVAWIFQIMISFKNACTYSWKMRLCHQLFNQDIFNECHL